MKLCRFRSLLTDFCNHGTVVRTQFLPSVSSFSLFALSNNYLIIVRNGNLPLECQTDEDHVNCCTHL